MAVVMSNEPLGIQLHAATPRVKTLIYTIYAITIITKISSLNSMAEWVSFSPHNEEDLDSHHIFIQRAVILHEVFQFLLLPVGKG
jgi:hypothetical protein